MNLLKPYVDVRKKGCFTQEYSLKGLTLKQIFEELGLPDRQLHEGANIIFALRLPTYDQFELGGYSKYSTEKFIKYGEKGSMNWNKTRFLKTYPAHDFNRFLRIAMAGWTSDSVEKEYGSKDSPMTIEMAKREWLRINNNRKLVKVIPILGPKDEDIYPAGGRANQIMLKKEIECQVIGHFMPNDIFKGVW